VGFWDELKSLPLDDFRPGVQSRVEIGRDLVMACMEIGSGREDLGHEHPFEQCGLVLQGSIEMFVGDQRRVLAAGEAYFIPAGARHGWRTFAEPVRLLDVSSKTT
jgi:quercetin dioxygenase-like cupin family protein